MKKHLFLILAPLLLMLLCFTNAFAGGDAIIIRVYEVGFNNPRITITTNEGSKQIKLEQSYKNEANLDKNAEAVLKTLNQYLKEGYRIETSNSTVHAASNQHITTYILTK